MLVLGLLLGLPKLSASGGPVYQPITPGWEWTYSSDQEESQHVVAVGQVTIRNRVAWALRHEIQGSNAQTYENYWTTDETGNLYLHGVKNLTYLSAVSYEPPFLWLNPPLYVGKTWAEPFYLCDGLDGDGHCDGPYTIPIAVTFEGNITVPAGTFHAFGIEELPPNPKRGNGPLGMDMLGMVHDNSFTLRSTTHWYVEDLGAPRFIEISDFVLVSWRPPQSTAVSSSTWGRVKALYF